MPEDAPPGEANAFAAALAAVEPVFAAQRKTAIALRTSAAHIRIEKLKRLEAAVLANQDGICRALAEDLGKPEAESQLTEIFKVISGIRHARRHLRSWMRPEWAPPTKALLGTSARIRREPRGVSLIIAPWNYPIAILLEPLTSAIAAGCPAILKPSEISQACSAVLARLIRRTFPPEEIAVFEGGAAVSRALLEMPFDHIFFTGSPETGKLVMAAAAKHLASVTLELGGKSPVIIDESADIIKAARSIAWAKFTNCGQTCIAPDYAYVHESRLAEFLAAMKDFIAQMYGDPARSPDYCRIVNERHFARIARLIGDAVARGATVVAGGICNEAQKYIAPTVLTGVDANAAVMQEEIFGPVLPVFPFSDPAGAIAEINARPKPLALYIYAKDRACIRRVLEETSAGGTCINAANLHYAHDNLPFGGIGQSGVGAYHGYYGFCAFSHERAVLEDKFSIAPFLFPPYTGRVKRMIDWTVRFFT
ncbi:MAG TPA: aldehyde dehydrogenase family protein [Methylocella sp.]|nr:aldehyde dehydrogenase family protein [Methylocella sp.]